MNNFKIEKYPCEIAGALYESMKDMDWSDYDEENEIIINHLENALYYLKALCENEYNPDYFRTFYKALENIT